MRRLVTVCLVMCALAIAFAQPASAGWWRRQAYRGYYVPCCTAPCTTCCGYTPCSSCGTTVVAATPCCQGTVAVAPVQTPSAPQPTLAPAIH